jgi:hypothetical protein
MVRRYELTPDHIEGGDQLADSFDGGWVRFEDFESLQDALREALEGWEEWLGSEEDADRVEFLRKEFLE